MQNEFMISSGLDQVTPLGDAKNSIFKKIDSVVEKAIADEDMQPVWSAGLQMSDIGRATGLGLAKLFYQGLQIWSRMRKGNEREFYEEAFVQMGYHKQTVKRGVRIWQMFEDSIIPKDYREEIMAMGVKMLSPISQVVSDGYEIPSNKWNAFANCVDESEVRKLCKEITGKEENSNNRKLFIDGDGDITVVTPSKIMYVGHLDVLSTDELVQQMISRICSAAGILEK